MLARQDGPSKKDTESIFMTTDTTYGNLISLHTYWTTNTPWALLWKSWKYYTQPKKTDLWTPLRNFIYTNATT
jgi:hypothetical protein